ncbi:hypothetical protein DEO72_LG11g1919 [Vigna unguiculata]|uniref:Uncharacterized protein n=1 Tax=Vigna unguiculata TaxID=3917 RepID=A0A4D6NM72_VIGUN|nr:hypothetical protein DEO72_LG11g1919 [Vigna unguiculata]
MIPNWKTLSEGTPQSFQEEWAAAKKDINTEVNTGAIVFDSHQSYGTPSSWIQQFFVV